MGRPADLLAEFTFFMPMASPEYTQQPVHRTRRYLFKVTPDSPSGRQ